MTAGCAHFPGTGPAGAVCKGCWHFGFQSKKPLNSQRCAKYRELMGGQDRNPPKIQPKTPACKYYEARP